MKKRVLFLVSLLTLILSLGVLSCEVGLGSQVDTMPPTVEIKTPEVGSIIRDDFAIRGSWQDDNGVEDVKLVLTRADKLGKPIHINGKVNKSDNTWETIVNAKTDHIVDGEYLATITFTDVGKHKTVATRTVVIDNTPPIVVLERPSSLITDSTYDTYGKDIVLKGEAADESKISQISIDFYADQNIASGKPVVTVDKYNIPNTIDLTIASFDEQPGSDYSLIYGATNGTETKSKYYSFKAYDGAQRYPINGEQTEEDKLGNCAEQYYLRKNVEIAKLFDIYKFKLPEMYEILSGVYDLRNSSASKTAIAVTPDVSIVKETLEKNENIVKNGSFNLNPVNNPTYAITGRPQVKTFEDFENNPALELSNGESSQITLEVATGLDNILIQEKDFKIVAYPVSSYDSVKNELILDEKNGIEIKNEVDEPEFQPLSIKPSGLNYVVTVTPVKNKVSLQTGTNYIVKVEGKDIAGNSFMTKGEGLGFGFRYTKLNVKSGVNITSVKRKNSSMNKPEDSAYFAKNDSLSVYGSITYEDELKNMRLEVALSDGDKELVKKEIPKNLIEGKNPTYNFDFTFDNVTEYFNNTNQDVGKTLKCILTPIDNTGAVVGNSTEDKTTVYYDTICPELTTLTPAVREAVPAIKTLTGTIDDKGVGVEKITYRVSKESSSVNPIEGKIEVVKNPDPEKNQSGIVGLKWNVYDLDLSSFGEGLLKLEVSATDKLGNSVTNNPVNFYYDKSLPVLTETGIKGFEITTNSEINLTGSVEDSDAIAEDKIISIEFDCGNKGKWTFNNNDQDTKITVVPAVDKKSATWSMTISPTKKTDNTTMAFGDDGFYTVTIKAWDVADKEVFKTKSITIDTVAPSGDIITEVPDNKWFNSRSLLAKVNNVSDDVVSVKAGFNKEKLVALNYDAKTSAYIGNVTSDVDGKELELYYELTDLAGNKTELSQKVNIDAVAPTISLVNVDGEKSTVQGKKYDKLTNGTKDTTVILDSGDTTSGIDSVKLSTLCGLSLDKSIDGVIISEGENIGKYKVTIPKDNIKSSKNKFGGVVFVVTDKAGNKTTLDAFDMTIDTEAPEATIGVLNDADIDTPDKLDVNKKVTITGTLKDNNNVITSAYLQYKKDGTEWTAPSAKVTNSADTGCYDISKKGYNWSQEVDTSSLTDKTDYNFRVYAVDKAGNIFAETKSDVAKAYKDVCVNQDSDRPVITFTNYENGKILNSNELIGTISDDDGLINNIKYTIGETEKTINVSNGSWKITGLEEGKVEIAFSVTDNAGTNFTNPKFKGSSDNSGKISLTVDTTPPVISDIKYIINNDDKTYCHDTISDAVIGGTKNILTVLFKATDENGIDESKNSVSLKDVNDDNLKIVKTEEKDTYKISYTFGKDINGFKQFKYSVTDKAGFTTEKSVQLNIDNKDPVVEIKEPVSENNSAKALSGAVVARGSVDSVATLYFAVTADNAKPKIDSNEDNKLSYGTSAWTLCFDNASKQGATGTKHTNSVNDYLVSLGKTNAEDINNGSYKKITPIYLWIKAVDEVGNESISDGYQMYIDPQGDRPEIVVSNAPKEGMLGASGSLSFFGSVIDTKGIDIGGKSVWMQLISDSQSDGYYNDTEGTVGDYTLAKADMDYMKKVFGDKLKNMRTGDLWTDSVAKESYADYGVEVTLQPNGSWNVEINDNGQFDAPEGKDINVVGVKFFATDKDNKLSDGKLVNVKFDSSKPKFSNLVLEQRDVNSEPLKSVNYIPGMYISGTGWVMKGTATDNDSVTSIRYKDGNVNRTELVGENGIKAGKTVNFEFPIDTKVKVGKKEISLDATDATSGRNMYETTITFNVDSQAPALTVPADEDINDITKYPEGYSINPTIRQDNSFYTFGSRLTEDTVDGADQSGLDFVAVYFKRGETIVNPLLLRGGDNKQNVSDINGKQPAADGLYWTEQIGCNVSNVDTSSNACTITVTSNKDIHINGLVKINGTYYLIKKDNFSANSITINGIPSSVTKAGDKVDVSFANAIIIDSPAPESVDPSAVIGSDGYYDSFTWEDGDKVIEAAKKTGSRWDWSASICSRNIPDGPIELHYVAIDKAGNAAHESVSAKVSNNAPRIAGVIIKTDYNGGNDESKLYTLDEVSIEKNYKDYYTGTVDGHYVFDWDARVEGKLKKNPLPTEFVLGSLEEGKSDNNIKIRGMTQIIPEIVGGNGKIYYQYDLGDDYLPAEYKGNGILSETSTGTLAGKGGELFTGETIGSINNTVVAVDKVNPITIQLGDLIRTKSSGPKAFKFTFWDSTPGSEYYVNSLKADMTLCLNVIGTEAKSPEIGFERLYWNNEHDNSLFENSSKNGHIELGDDLNAELKKIAKQHKIDIYDNSGSKLETKTVYNDMVSGKIVLKGIIKNETLLDQIYLKIPAMGHNEDKLVYDVGNNGVTTSLESDGYEFSIENTTGDAKTGYIINWKLVWDTSKIENVAQLDVDVNVNAACKTNPRLTSVTGGLYEGISGAMYGDYEYDITKGTAKTGYYDVVPYITTISRDSKTERTRRGSISLARLNKAETVKDIGNNYRDETKKDKIELENARFTISGFNIPNNTPAKVKNMDLLLLNNYYYLNKNSVSGNVDITVNGIQAINNLNDNGLSYNKEIGDAYNGQSDKEFPIVSDDRYVHVWRINDQDIFQRSNLCSFPTMGKDATGKLYAAFTTGSYCQIFVSPKFLGNDSFLTPPKTTGEDKNSLKKGEIKRIYAHAMPASDMEIAVNGSGDTLDVDVAYGSNYRSTVDKGFEDSGNGFKEEHSGGAYLYSDRYNSKLGGMGEGTKAPFSAYRGQLYSYDQYIDQFVHMNVARGGDFVYSAYYDKLNSTINFSAVRTNEEAGIIQNMKDSGLPWVVIDGMGTKEFTVPSMYKPTHTQGFTGYYNTRGGPKDTDTKNLNFQFGNPYALSDQSYGTLSKTDKTGEYVALDIIKQDNNCYPILVYVDYNSGKLRIAKSTSISGTLGFIETQAAQTHYHYVDGNQVIITKKLTWKDTPSGEIEHYCGSIDEVGGIGASNVYESPESGTSPEVKDRSTYWNIQEIDVSGLGDAASYVSCKIDNDGYLHIVYKTKEGKLVYLKSDAKVTNNSTDTFDGNRVIVDDKCSNIDLSLKGNTPYISYIGVPDSANGLKIAFPMTVNGKIEWETMIAPSVATVKDSKTSIETEALAFSDTKKYDAAVGTYTGDDYRALFYVGE